MLHIRSQGLMKSEPIIHNAVFKNYIRECEILSTLRSKLLCRPTVP